MRAVSFSLWPFFLVGAIAAAHLSDQVSWPTQPWRGIVLATLTSGFVALILTRTARFRRLVVVPVTMLAAISGALHVDDERGDYDPPSTMGIARVEGTVSRLVALPPHYPDAERSLLSLEDADAVDGSWTGERIVCITPRPRVAPPVGARVQVVGFLRREASGLRLDIGSSTAISPVPSLRTGIALALERVRARVARRYDELLDDDASRLMRELILGESLAEARETESRRRAGVQHFFAVSGFHLTLVAAILFGRRRVGRRPSLMGDGFVASILAAYALIVGAQASVLRALVVALLYLGARSTRRTVDAGWILVVAGAMLVLFEPRCVRSIGFLLSLSAVAGLRFLAGPVFRADEDDPVDRFVVRKLRERIPWLVRNSLVCSLAASLATAPATIARFNGFSLVGVVANLLLLMPMTLLVVLGMALPFVPPLRFVIEPLVRAANDLIEFIASPAAAYVDVPTPSGLTIIALVTVLVATAFVLPILPRRQRLWAMAVPAVSTAFVIVAPAPSTADALLCLSSDEVPWTLVARDGRATAISDDPLFAHSPAAIEARRIALASGCRYTGIVRPPVGERDRLDDRRHADADRLVAITDRSGERLGWSSIGATGEVLILTARLDGPAALRLATSREPPARLALTHSAATAGDALGPLFAAWPKCILVVPDRSGDRHGLVATARRHGIGVELLR